MHPWQSRRLTAVPQHWPVRMEIIKAIHTLAAEIKEEELRKRAQAAELQRKTETDEVRRACDELIEAARDVYHYLRKYGFDPNEPRVPRGNPGAGQWTDEDWVAPSRASVVLSDAQNTWTPGAQYAANETPPPGIGHNQGPPLEDPPKIPPRLPEKIRLINNFLKAAAYWLATSLPRDPKVRRFFAGLRATKWLMDSFFSSIKSYLDPPKSWDELQQNALSPRPGYDIHHPVEQEAAEDAGFPESLIDGPGNRLSVPRLKHWLITGWYMTKNEEFGDVSPRTYLRDKSWDERLRVGRLALIRFGVLKP